VQRSTRQMRREVVDVFCLLLLHLQDDFASDEGRQEQWKRKEMSNKRSAFGI
jgi:hypothetical protein